MQVGFPFSMEPDAPARPPAGHIKKSSTPKDAAQQNITMKNDHSDVSSEVPSYMFMPPST